ncbi:unnamed protein product [Caenorhabditis auriculariae]|uniref:Uncharacterized protein n=1 Tax=Caenorhabditis auriculariae TaxID=2777116 RepID=A0A8S1HG03_9PELO|nr:unnamed protein product [Caenorhabditis auriculariae]
MLVRMVIGHRPSGLTTNKHVISAYSDDICGWKPLSGGISGRASDHQQRPIFATWLILAMDVRSLSTSVAVRLLTLGRISSPGSSSASPVDPEVGSTQDFVSELRERSVVSVILFFASNGYLIGPGFSSVIFVGMVINRRTSVSLSKQEKMLDEMVMSHQQRCQAEKIAILNGRVLFGMWTQKNKRNLGMPDWKTHNRFHCKRLQDLAPCKTCGASNQNNHTAS